MEITVVRKENQDAFENLMPRIFWEKEYFVLGAIEENTACGVIAVHQEDTFFSIQYIYVEEEFRRRGIGTALLESVHVIAKQCGMDATYCQYAENADTELLMKCFKKNLFSRDENDSPIYKVLFKDLSVKLLDREPRVSEGDLLPLSEVASGVWKGFKYKLEQLATHEDNIPEIEKKAVYDQEVSFMLEHKGEAEGCILIKRQEDNYVLACLCVLGHVNPLNMMGLFQASYQAMKDSCNQDTEITINALTEITKKMVIDLTDDNAKQVATAATWYYVY